jgi:hypothetical protein
MTAIEIIDAEVRDVVRREGIDPVADPGAIRTIVEQVVASYDEGSLSRPLPPAGRFTVRHANGPRCSRGLRPAAGLS